MRGKWWLVAALILAIVAAAAFLVFVDASFADFRLPPHAAEVPQGIRERWGRAARLRVVSSWVLAASLLGAAGMLAFGAYFLVRRRSSSR